MNYNKTIMALFIISFCVACGNQSDSSSTCLANDDCILVQEHSLEFGADGVEFSAIDFGSYDIVRPEVFSTEEDDDDLEIVPDISADMFRREVGSKLASDDVIAAKCSAVAEEIIADCIGAKREVRQCELRGSWIYSGCKGELSGQINASDS